MTTLHLRTNETQRAPSSGLLLDWFGRGGASTVSGSVLDLVRDLGTPMAPYVDLLGLAVGAYGADKAVLRKQTPDRWTRRLDLHVPVTESARWASASAEFSEALAYLTSDEWRIRFRRATPRDAQDGAAGPAVFDTVSLFSGGLDSLVGAIDLLEAGHTAVLVGHYDSNPLRPRQQSLFERLRDVYGADRVIYRPFYLRPLGPQPAQTRPLPADREPSTRSRSFLFIAAAAVTASAAGTTVVHVPENGYIGLNVPLEPNRLGACSTRTTHPHFMLLLGKALASAAIELAIENPYRLMTKGEVLGQCRNLPLLFELAAKTISCAHPEVGRWSQEGYANCGYCYPCLMRRVALHHVGADEASHYRFDVTRPGFLSRRGRKTEHLRAILQSLERPAGLTDILSGGPLPRGETAAFGGLYERGRSEIRAWLAAAMPASA